MAFRKMGLGEGEGLWLLKRWEWGRGRAVAFKKMGLGEGEGLWLLERWDWGRWKGCGF